jgi:hypothetical protein
LPASLVIYDLLFTRATPTFYSPSKFCKKQTMGKKRKKEKFSISRKEQCAAFNIGHSWYNQGDDISDDEIETEEVITNDIPQQTPSEDSEVDRAVFVSASARKIDLNKDFAPDGKGNGYRIVDLDILDMALMNSVVCKTCKVGSVSLKERPKAGWATELCFVCDNEQCYKKDITPTNTFSSSAKSGSQYIVNKLMVLGMRYIGKGRSGAEKFSSVMGLPKPICQEPFANYTRKWDCVALDCADESMTAAAQAVKDLLGSDTSESDSVLPDSDAEDMDAEDNVDTSCNDTDSGDSECDDSGDESCDEDIEDVKSEDGIVTCAVSVDGSWLNRGFHSRHGFVSVISMDTGKVLDRIYLCSTCKQCSKWAGKDKEGEEYLAWYTDHEPKCLLNHDGSPQSMEAVGAVTLFGRSMEKNQLRYNPYVGDGDSKSYIKVVRSKPYGHDYNIYKQECVGHVQKRMGTRSRRLITKYKGNLH